MSNRPEIVVTGMPLTDKHSRPAALNGLRKLATAQGWEFVGATWALARCTVKRKIPGAKGEGSFREVDLERASVVARFGKGQDACWVMWFSDDGAAWEAQPGGLRSATVEVVREVVTGARKQRKGLEDVVHEVIRPERVRPGYLQVTITQVRAYMRTGAL